MNMKKQKKKEIYDKPIMNDLFLKFYGKIKGLSAVQKINLAYTYLASKKPDPNLKTNKQLDRILYELEFGEKIKASKKAQSKKVKLPQKFNRLMKSSRKKKEHVFIMFLTRKNDLIPMLLPLWSGNIVIVKSRPYEVDPRAFFTLGKHKVMIIREIDRRPISNLDYDQVRARGDATDSDEFLIKLAMRAKTGGVKKQVDKKVIIIVAIVIAIAAIWFFTQG